MARKGIVPLLYVDTCIFLNVIRREAGLWPSSLKILLALGRDDIRLIASTLLLVEVGSGRGDVERSIRDRVIASYLQSGPIEWCELDLFVANEARLVADQYGLRGADAAHLATAIRHKADYFVTRDRGFPIGTTVGSGTKVIEPAIIWNPTLDDVQVDAEEKAELDALQAQREAEQRAAEIARRLKLATKKAKAQSKAAPQN